MAHVPENEAQSLMTDVCLSFVKLSRMVEVKLNNSPAHGARFRLIHAVAHGGQSTLPDLSRETCVSTPSLCLMLKQLCEEGLVWKTTKPGDARVSLYALTRKGHAWLKDEFAGRRKIMADMVATLPSEEIPALYEHLEPILQAVRVMTGYTQPQPHQMILPPDEQAATED